MNTCQMVLYHSILLHTRLIYTCTHYYVTCSYVVVIGSHKVCEQICPREKMGFYIPKYRHFVCIFYFQAAVDKIFCLTPAEIKNCLHVR